MNRRSFLQASAAVILTPGLLMPVRKLILPEPYLILWGPTATEIALIQQQNVAKYLSDVERVLLYALPPTLRTPPHLWFRLGLGEEK